MPFVTLPSTARSIAFATIVLALQACAESPAPEAATVQVIVRFASDSGDPSDAAFRARLATAARVARLDLVRPMSGKAWVMRMTCDGDEDPRAYDDAIRRLAALAAVASIERDGRERHQ